MIGIYRTNRDNLSGFKLPVAQIWWDRLLGGLMLLAILTGCQDKMAVTETVSLKSDSSVDTLEVGDLFYLNLDAQWPDSLKAVHLALAVSPDTILIAGADSTNVAAREGWINRRYRLGLIATREGEFDLPPLRLISGNQETIATSQGYHLVVNSRLDDSASPELKPLAEMASLRDIPWFLLGAVLLGIALVVIAWFIWRRRFRQTQVDPGPPPIPPGIEFREGIENLISNRLPEKGQMRRYAQELSWLFRRYLGRRLSQPALEATRPEILRWLPNTKLEVKEQQLITAWLEQTDSIKFAGRIPLLDETERLRTEAETIVKRCEDAAAEEERRRLAALSAGLTDETNEEEPA